MNTLQINGRAYDAPEPSRNLLSFIRFDAGLTGTKYGCGEGLCGACTVLVDGQALRSCTIDRRRRRRRRHHDDRRARARRRALHPVQQAFVDENAMQCGYCIPGFIMTSVALLARDSRPDEAQIREALSQNMCRCGTYQRILRAVRTRRAKSARPCAMTDAVRPGSTSPARSRSGSRRRRAAYASAAYANTQPDAAKAPGSTVRPDGTVVAYAGKVEYGQGIRTGFADRGRRRAARAASRASTVVLGDTGVVPWDMGTFGSQSTARIGLQLRQAAATARQALLELAADRLDLPVDRSPLPPRRRRVKPRCGPRGQLRGSARRPADRPRRRGGRSADAAQRVHGRWASRTSSASTLSLASPAARSTRRTSSLDGMLFAAMLRRAVPRREPHLRRHSHRRAHAGRRAGGAGRPSRRRARATRTSTRPPRSRWCARNGTWRRAARQHLDMPEHLVRTGADRIRHAGGRVARRRVPHRRPRARVDVLRPVRLERTHGAARRGRAAGRAIT